MLDARREVRQSERMLIERAREKPIEWVRRASSSPARCPRLAEATPRAAPRGSLHPRAALLLATAALAGLVGCGAPQAEQSGSRAPGVGAATDEGRASYYADKLAGHRTANGEPYDPSALTAAHRTLPFGTMVEVTRPDGRHVTVRINDRGPHKRGRVIDLSRRAAEQIGLVRDGVGEVSLRVVSLPPGR